MSVIIKISNLSKLYNDRSILKNIDLTIETGEFLCIIGPSGGGKSTLLNLIGGFIKSDGGSVSFQGETVNKPNRECIMVFQEFDQLFPWKTVQENIEFPLKNDPHHYSKTEIAALTGTYIDMVKLHEFKDFYPHQLSGGMKQRTAIARALVTTPKVLLMDEPFGSLDILTKTELQDTMLEIWKKTQTTIVFVTHDVREALHLADQIIILGDGTVQQRIENKTKDSEERVKEIIGFLSP
ncbi:ABC transporter ATP-binding protein [Acetobacterium bakii]|uniref:Nitrate ABC transporter substrate-binding protein n=1 Tax=Acetobacterium bakii TaxID=52689 RepID=A0A0L6U6I2_9FIRM|nr:ABC transporter ATP-binding protein [Acetobacterium bakii]KNZ43385.1 nitrate ABC transporter substrate-binding protein [Acetobacterium bakii]